MQRFDVYLAALDPTVGREIKKTRPCLIVSPNEMNLAFATVLIAPMTSGGYKASTRVPIHFQGKHGFILLDQMRTVDKSRLLKKAGHLPPAAGSAVLAVLQAMFTE